MSSNFLHNPLRNKRGSLLMILIMSAVVFLILVGMGFYVKNAVDAASKIKSKNSTRVMIESLFNRVLNVYTQPLEGKNCDSALTAAALNFRNFANSAPNIYNLNTENPTTIACLLESDEADLLDMIFVTITPEQSFDDITSKLRSLKIEIKIKPKNNLLSQTTTRTYSVSLLTLDEYGVIFNSSSVDAIKLLHPQAKIIFDTQVLQSNKTAPWNIQNLIPSGSLPYRYQFKQPVYTLSPTLRTTNNVGIKLVNLDRIFQAGVITNHLRLANNFPTTDPTLNWNQKIDYAHVYAHKNPTGSSNLSPLPDLAPSPKTAFNGGGLLFNNGSANFNTLPKTNLLTHLDETCETSDNRKMMVIYKKSADFTLDFSSNQGTSKFCGLLFVKTLTVKLKPNVDNYLIGKFFFSNLIVHGAGTLYIVDPEIDSNLSSNYSTVMNISAIRQEFHALEMMTANPFFQPLARNLADRNPDFGHLLPSHWFTTPSYPPASCTNNQCFWSVPGSFFRMRDAITGLPKSAILFSTPAQNRNLYFKAERTF